MIENPLWILLFTFVVAGVPLFVSLGTSYVKVHIVLGMLRNGLGTQNVPGPMVVAALSLAITGVVMAPVLQKTCTALEELEVSEDTELLELLKSTELSKVFQPWRAFMQVHAGERELLVFTSLQQNTAFENDQDEASDLVERPGENDLSDPAYASLVPAFIVSELKEAFAMAFALLLPFLVIDVVVSNILVGLGMYMVSPVLISLPLKLLIFVFADGWLLVVNGLIRSYQVGL